MGAVKPLLPRFRGQSLFSAGCGALMFLAVLLVLLGSFGCDTSRKRAVGYFKLGSAESLAREGTHFFEDLRIVLRYDERGFSAMSTECPYDGAALMRVREGERVVWRSPSSGSVYDQNGTVLHGPSTYNLPYYELKVDRDSYEGSIPTLYVHVGVNKDQDWRLSARGR